jgi:CubicO group peptidase (beta-lactamase class C family)
MAGIMTTRAVMLAAAGIAVLTTGPTAQPRTSAATVAAIIERELKLAGVAGATFAVVSGSESATLGFALPPETPLQVGSLNKLMTALALVATLDARKISLHSRVGEHLPGLHPRLAAVTFHQLLSQTSGLRDHAGADGTSGEDALLARVRAIGDADFVLPAATVFSYSNLGYATAGAALEHLRNKPFADALREAVLQPLRMIRSTMRPAAVDGLPATFDLDTSLWPAGYLWTTAHDMLQPLTLLTRGVVAGTAWPAIVLARVTSAHTPMPNVFVGGHYGYGLMLASDRGVRFYEHGGTQRGYSSILRVAPDRRLGIVILSNQDNAPLRRVAQTVMAEALQLPNVPPAPRAEAPASPEEMTVWLGTYRNRGTAEIAVREGRVVLILDGGAPMVVTRIGAQRYLARPTPEIAGPEFVLQPATASSPAYLHFALWAYARRE